MLEAFAELVSERYGYWMGRRLTQQDMSEQCKEELKAVRDKRTELSDNIDQFLETPIDDLKTTIKANQKDLASLRKVVAEKTKPFREKIAPLAKAQRYCDNVCIPDSLKELGHPVAPRFSLSDWIEKALDAEKAQKKKK
jgi:hypothetical protein